ncbi:MAG: pyridoxal-phosphate dependent enzyme, partial [Deltaproteobacteria bacterium]|nr:pyridoxal-phosphate dependent enzyme [Deltaproteobacteria bacterium]
GGVGIIGIYKAFKELQEMGWVNERMPRLVAVQSTGCAPIIKAWEEGQTASEFWHNAKTLAFGITVPKALGDFLVLEAIYKTNGCAVSVTDEKIIQAENMLASREGAFVCPEGAATLSAALKLAKTGWISSNENVVLLNTGSGLKYPETVKIEPKILTVDDHL